MVVHDLDIFEHSRDVMLRNDLVEVLLRRDASAARSARQALADAFVHEDPLKVQPRLPSCLTCSDESIAFSAAQQFA